ncbi:uncharacterized protein LOC123548814 isoform X2 [Mercenaria mercenaria]|uniref:uncharacterized protein LOC123548814 isoform X2 n=1 Tax=Mercenaria mercenaria TaxID=6596 RepID=UPI00234F0856|nr:uncharacterized protein LOC123548814 isoform X2 [Mercenaria mercenaria]
MLPLWRIIPRTQGVFIKRIYSGVSKPVVEFPVHVFGQAGVAGSGRIGDAKRGIVSIEGVQGEHQELQVSEARRVMRLATEYQCQGPSIQGTQDNQDYSSSSLTGHDLQESGYEAHETLSKEDVHSSVFEGLGSHVCLNGCMQSNVPKPFNTVNSTSGYGSYLNMPGGGGKLLDKYCSGSSQDCHQSRNFSTSIRQWASQQGAQDTAFEEEEYLTDPTPQGIQGDNCVQFRLWMENCQRYNLPNCDEQLESITAGRKTLAQVFQEQQEIIRLVAESYKNNLRQSQKQMDSETNAQGQQDYFGYSFEFSTTDPCPQGLQGDHCANYKVWAHNCSAFGFGDCNEKLRDIQSGRRILQDVFDEQDQMIRKIVADFQQKRSYSTSSKPERA